MVKEFVHQTLTVLEAHQALAGPMLSLVAGLEGLAVIGVFVPATALIVVLGGAIASGVVTPWLLVWCMGGAFAGAWASYEAGRWARRGGSPFQGGRFAGAVDQVSRLFARFGDVAIVVGRFTGVTAGLAPFAAGYMGMGRRRFALACTVTSVSWPLVMAAVGYAGARGAMALSGVHAVRGALFAAAVAIAAGAIAGLRWLGYRRRKAAAQLPLAEPSGRETP
ncbi:DedA family protein [Caulobacter sp. S45]|uniref:DedA family protein n=1 Tax=Caulobacter sp. S45 TaxID=1641861 RepID=UPI0020B12B01|nr:DedA family protein [Caulobacter sp. S45]